MSATHNLRGKRRHENESVPPNTDTVSTSGAPLPEPSNIKKAKRARTSPVTSKVSHKKDENVKQSASLGLLGLPIEILTEIASLAQPGGLISLARSCKKFRSMLMKSSAVHIWRFAENNVDALPHCPDDMCEPQYAALLFTKSCTSCGVTTSSKADPFIRVRLCSQCREIKLVVVGLERRGGRFTFEPVPFTKLIKFQPKDTGRRMYRPTNYCLVDEADEIRSQQKALVDDGNTKALKRWRRQQDSYVKERHLFGELLNQFLLSVSQTRLEELENLKMRRKITIEERLRALGWSDTDLDFRVSTAWHKWWILLNQSKALTDRGWMKLLPQLVPLLETNRHDHSERKKKERKQDRGKVVHTLLQDLKTQSNPFQALLEEHGFNSSEPVDTSETGSKFLNSLIEYPFPNYATVLELPCLEDVNTLELSAEEVEELFYEHQEEIEEMAVEWRQQGEQRLVDRWRAKGGSASTGGVAETSLSNTEILLRADTIFSYSSPEDLDYRQRPARYPEFISRSSTYSTYAQSTRMEQAPPYRCVEAERITKAILGRHGMPDVTYYKLKVLGTVFVCARCEDQEPKTWDEVIEHYTEEGSAWLRQSSRKPIIKTSNPILVRNTHDISVIEKPFFRPLGVGAEEPAVTPTLNLSKSLDCLLCKNRHHRRTFTNLNDMQSHLLDVHEISSNCSGLTHESSANVDCFHERTKKWKKEWKSKWDYWSPRYL